jgi:lysozyme
MSGIFTFGIDVSHHQGKIDWDKVKGGPSQFVFMKATEHTGFVSKTFASNWEAAKGLKRGAYHFFRPSIDGAAQAEHFLNTWRPAKGDLLPVIDVEDFDGSSKAKFAADMEAWIDRVSAAIGGKRPFIYTTASFWKKIGDPGGFESFPLWVAHYTHGASPKLPKGWSDYTIWQYSQTGRVDGVRTDCDVNLFNGEPRELARYVI